MLQPKSEITVEQRSVSLVPAGNAGSTTIGARELTFQDAPIARLRDVTLRYGLRRPALQGVDLRIEAGSFQFLVGPSGAGKTSLLRLLSLSHRPNQGRVDLFGVDAAHASASERRTIRQRIGVVYQGFRLLDHISAFDNVALPLRILGVEEVATRTRVAEIMAWLGLADLIEKFPEDISTGERQLVAVARAVITRPQLILADEPTSSVDDARADRLMSLFEHLNRSGVTVVLATHSRRLMAGRNYPLVEIAKGRLLAVQPPARLIPPLAMSGSATRLALAG